MLKYTGGGHGGSLPGYPARDLSDDEVAQLGGEQALLDTSLYERVQVARKPIAKVIEEVKVENDEEYR